MNLSLIAAMSENRVIGRGGKLPWCLPADLKRFKSLTIGHAMIMGRRTFESIGRPLPGRRSIILSRSEKYRPSGTSVVPSLQDALALVDSEVEIFIIGGAQIYQLAMPLADRIYLTIVHAVLDGDAFFPSVDLEQWRLIDWQRYEADDVNEFPYTFCRYDRASATRVQ